MFCSIYIWIYLDFIRSKPRWLLLICVFSLCFVDEGCWGSLCCPAQSVRHQLHQWTWSHDHLWVQLHNSPWGNIVLKGTLIVYFHLCYYAFWCVHNTHTLCCLRGNQEPRLFPANKGFFWPPICIKTHPGWPTSSAYPTLNNPSLLVCPQTLLLEAPTTGLMTWEWSIPTPSSCVTLVVMASCCPSLRSGPHVRRPCWPSSTSPPTCRRTSIREPNCQDPCQLSSSVPAPSTIQALSQSPARIHGYGHHPPCFLAVLDRMSRWVQTIKSMIHPHMLNLIFSCVYDSVVSGGLRRKICNETMKVTPHHKQARELLCCIYCNLLQKIFHGPENYSAPLKFNQAMGPWNIQCRRFKRVSASRNKRLHQFTVSAPLNPGDPSCSAGSVPVVDAGRAGDQPSRIVVQQHSVWRPQSTPWQRIHSTKHLLDWRK